MCSFQKGEYFRLCCCLLFLGSFVYCITKQAKKTKKKGKKQASTQPTNNRRTYTPLLISDIFSSDILTRYEICMKVFLCYNVSLLCSLVLSLIFPPKFIYSSSFWFSCFCCCCCCASCSAAVAVLVCLDIYVELELRRNVLVN